jgi:phospholipid-binding lipoprotein MlaA
MPALMSRAQALLRAAALLCVALIANGCASAPGRTTPDDPLQGLNRGVFKFNDTLDRAAVKPIAKGYKKVVPGFVRAGIGNFLSNIEYPVTIVNEFLQGKPANGFRGLGRFVLNSTLGVAGILDVGTPVGLEATDEDFGQTLAVWGVKSGPFVMLPFFGPSSLRDAPSRIVDYFLTPLSYTDDVHDPEIPWEAEWGERVLDAVHSRAELLTVDQTLQRTFDQYAFVRDAWVQQREFVIFDGNPPPETLEDFEDEPEAAK